MVAPTTAEFQHMVVEVETETPGTFAKICGITSRGINRAHNVNETSYPQDCEDESLPLGVNVSVESSQVTISGSGAWASQSHEMMLDWWYAGQPKNIRVHHVNAKVGDTEYETGPALLVSLNNQAEKGDLVTAETEIRFKGVPTRTAKAS